MTYTVHGQWPDGFNTQVTVANTGKETINGWTLKWSFPGGQEVRSHWSTDLSQSGATVTAKNLAWNKTIKPGGSITFGFLGAEAPGPNLRPERFLLNGTLCR